jgi:hypothetical protein
MTTPHHRPTAADRPSAGSRQSSGARPSSGAGTPRGVGSSVAEDLTNVAGASSGSGAPQGDDGVWSPRAATPQELDDARTVLVVHRLDPGTRRCAACAADCPCPPALDAGRVLAEAGAWNTVPFTGFTRRQTDQARTQAADGWVIRLARRLPWVAAE